MARVLITGATGQLGSYLAEELVAEGHTVFGLGSEGDVRPLSPGVDAPGATLEDVPALFAKLGSLDAVVHFAGRSSVSESWDTPLVTFDVNARLTAAIVFCLSMTPTVRLVHASSAEIFGQPASPIQDESTPLAPISPYAVSKAAAHLTVRFGREAYGAPMSNLIFYLGESPRRAPHFVVRKITRGVAAIVCGKAECVVLGNTEIVRDFSHARDLAHAAKLLALGAPPGDYICGSGVGHSIADVAAATCRIAGLDPRHVVTSDRSLYRPTDIPSLIGDSSRLRALGWIPTLGFEALIRELFEHDLAEMRTGLRPEETKTNGQ